MKQQVFPRNKLKKRKIMIIIIIIIKHEVNKWVKQLGLIVIEFLPNLRDFPIPACRMDLKRDTYHVLKVSLV